MLATMLSGPASITLRSYHRPEPPNRPPWGIQEANAPLNLIEVELWERSSSLEARKVKNRLARTLPRTNPRTPILAPERVD